MSEKTFTDAELIEVELAKDFRFHCDCVCKCGLRFSQHSEWWLKKMVRGSHRFEEMICRVPDRAS